MTCPLEKQLAVLLAAAGIEYRHPDRDRDDPTTLDFFLPAFNLYIEVKQFHSARIAGQLERVPEQTTAIVLMGPRAIADFERLCAALSKGSR